MKKALYISLSIISLFYAQEYSSLAGNPREYYNYELKDGRKIVYKGQTNDLKRRESEHERDGKKFTHMRKVGNAKTYEGALKAEKQSLKQYRNGHGGKNPKYNQTDHG